MIDFRLNPRLRNGLLLAFTLVFTLGAAGLAFAGRVNSTLDIPYIDGSGAAQSLDVYAPKRAGRYPVLLYVHGGAWMHGDKRREREQGEYFAKQGVVFVSVNYRLAPAHKHPAQIRDVAAATKWVVDHIGKYGGDVENLSLAGHSAGAHLAALLAVHPDYLRAHELGLDVFKAVMPVDTASYDFTVKPDREWERFITRAIVKTFGRRKAVLEAASPTLMVEALTRKEARSLPVFKLFVTSERPDAVMQTYKFYRAILKVGGEAQQYVVGGASHRDMHEYISDKDNIVGREMLKAIKD